jgi:rhodanese-related sulfurtransferase
MEERTLQPNKTLAAVVGAISLSVATLTSAAPIPTDDNGNRYDKERFYHSEISSAEAYLAMMQNKLVIIDVRRLREYAAGHPERAYNVPYPHIYGGRDQNPQDFYDEVYDIVKGKTDTPIMTLCRTGSRSVDAANILAEGGAYVEDPNDPDNDVWVEFGPKFTNVRNNWDGFVGQLRYAFFGSPPLPDPEVPLDLNNNGFIDEDVADIFPDTNPGTKDANPDKDGWRNFQGLPWTTHILKPRAYMQDPSLYYEYQYEDEPHPKAIGRRPK